MLLDGKYIFIEKLKICGTNQVTTYHIVFILLSIRSFTSRGFVLNLNRYGTMAVTSLTFLSLLCIESVCIIFHHDSILKLSSPWELERQIAEDNNLPFSFLEFYDGTLYSCGCNASDSLHHVSGYQQNA